MKPKALKTIINRVQPARLRHMLRFWLAAASPVTCDVEALRGLLTRFDGLSDSEAVAFQRHCYEHHHFLIVWAGDDLSGFYQDASGQPCVLRLLAGG